jgi:hypothetical protein
MQRSSKWLLIEKERWCLWIRPSGEPPVLPKRWEPLRAEKWIRWSNFKLSAHEAPEQTIWERK